MEPLFFKAENGLARLDGSPENLASMEPLFFKAENDTSLWTAGENAVVLQWSRFFSKRKITGNRITSSDTWIASMEPLFFKAENSKGRRP